MKVVEATGAFVGNRGTLDEALRIQNAMVAAIAGTNPKAGETDKAHRLRQRKAIGAAVKKARTENN
jgi:hypothetical protein